jgi:3-dehydroquinate synthase
MNQALLTVRVELSDRGYDICIGRDILSQAGQRIRGWLKLTHAVVIADQNVLSYAETVRASLQAEGVRVDLFEVPPGEQTKTTHVAESLWQQMLDCGADRKSVVIAVGGGVVGDLAGFIAATFGRGVAFVQVPTTLLAHVDSSVGGKVGVNLPQAKNMVGAFWQPRGVLIDIAALDTLPDREYRAGLAEVVKYGVIMDSEFFNYLEQNTDAINSRQPDVLCRMIERCCQLKADVVENDEREETGLRAILNYGHTFCHAVESVAGYGRYLHGEAVSIGMLCASRLAELLGRVDPDVSERQRALLAALQLPLEIEGLDDDALVQSMLQDKKVEHGQLRFVLPDRIGHVELVGDVPMELARRALRVE